MTDPREVLVALLHNEGDGGIWEHFDRKNSEAVADAILAEFDVTPRGVHNHDIDPSCPETRLPDGSLRGECMTPRGEGAPGLASDLRRAADRCCQCTDGHHDWVAPYGTDDDVRISRDDARRIASLLDGASTVKPSVEDVARRHSRVSMDGTCICGAVGIGFVLGYGEHLVAETLALLPGRTEAEVKAGELREAAIYAPGGPRVTGWLRERADQWEEQS